MPETDPKRAAVFAAVTKLREISENWARAAGDEIDAKKALADAESRKKALHESYTKLVDMANLFGFDLDLEFEKATRGTKEIEPSAGVNEASAIAAPIRSDKRKTVKEYAIDAARHAYPNPIRASALRRVLEDIGLKVHEKTVGMTLYRLLCDGVLRRQGWDWFFVPETERPSRAQEQEEERSGDDPDLSLELT